MFKTYLSVLSRRARNWRLLVPKVRWYIDNRKKPFTETGVPVTNFI